MQKVKKKSAESDGPEKRYHFRVDDMYKFSLRVLTKAGYPEDYAKATAYALLEADKMGIYSHGIAGGTGLEEAVKRSGITAAINPKAKPEFLDQKYPTIALIKANGAPGHITSVMAVDLVKKLAREYGFAKVFVNDANHFGAAGVWSQKIAEDGDLKGEVSCTTVAFAKPMGDDPEGIDYTKGASNSVRVGTNPIAISIPHNDGILTLDTALTRMAVSYCLKKYKAGEMLRIPEYIADRNYKSSLDPEDFVESGSVFPLGSTLAGYKGDALLRMIEADQSLGGGPIELIPWKGKGSNRRISHTFIAQVIDFLYTKEDARKRVRELMKDYETGYFGTATRWPGDRSAKAVRYSLKEGIPYSKGQIDTLRRSAEHVGLDFDKILKPEAFKIYPKDIFNK